MRYNRLTAEPCKDKAAIMSIVVTIKIMYKALGFWSLKESGT